MIATLIFILAFLIRIYHLDYFPLNTDEAEWFWSPEKLSTFLGLPITCSEGGIQPFFAYLVFFTRKIFFSPELVVRIPAVIIGSATVVLIYLLAKEMYGKKAGLVVSLLLAFLPWHIIQSRIGVSLVLTPFFSCAIFLSLLKAIHKQNDRYFLLSCFLLSVGSFYTYQNSVLLMPIFMFILIILRKDLLWLKPKTAFLSMLIFLAVIYPLIHLQFAGKINFIEEFYRPYQVSPFQGNILLNLLSNSLRNIPEAFKTLFFSNKGIIFYADTFQYPLLINKITLFFVISSIIISLRQRLISDKIILAWFSLGLLGSCAGVNFFFPHYVIIIMPVFVILIARFMSGIFNCAPNKVLFKRKLFFLEAFFCAGLVFAGAFQWINYYRSTTAYFDKFHSNDYFCKEAAYYLSRIPNIKNYCVFIQGDMWPIFPYLFRLTGLEVKDLMEMRRQDGRIYIIWAAKSEFFKKTDLPDPIKVIYDPNGLEAIYIFEGKNDLLEKARWGKD